MKSFASGPWKSKSKHNTNPNQTNRWKANIKQTQNQTNRWKSNIKHTKIKTQIKQIEN
jgi:hypothetical protein